MSMRTLLPFLLLLPSFLFAQRQALVWHCGFGNSLNFNSGSPVQVSGSQQSTFEGCASYCDAMGNFLFYTNGGGREPAQSGQDGGHIWNRNNAVMYDMQGIEGGGFSAAQSSVIFEAPGEDSVYYVFTMDEIEFNSGASPGIQAAQPNGRGLSYFKVDMTLNGGLGGVTLADQRVYAPSKEGLCAVRHANGRDYWIIMHRDSTGLGVYSVTPSGVAFAGAYTALGGSFGKIKASPSGTFLAAKFVNASSSPARLFLFNNSTGSITNPIVLNSEVDEVEFSPNSNYLYSIEVSATGPQWFLKQYDLLAANIPSSGILLGNLPLLSNSLQLGPDGKIYFLTYGSEMTLNRVACPNTTAPSLELNLFDFTGGTFFGLPNFPAWLFKNNNSEYVSLGPDTMELCGSTTSITLDARNPGMNYLWSTGDTTQTIQVSQQGTYWVQVLGNCGVGSDTVFVRNCELGSCLTFTYNGTNQPQTFTVPAGIDSISVKMWGAAGGSGPIGTGDAIGGAGGYTEFSLSVTPGETFSISVGQGGKKANGNQGGAGGWPGGGNGGTGTLFESPSGTSIPVGGGGGGGGATIFRRAGNNTILAVAGAGGGAAQARYGGNGGGLEAGFTIAQNAQIFNQFGFGGTQTAGGAPASNTLVANAVFGTAGSFLQGGTGATDVADAFRKGGGGGGAGWYGGGGGSSYDASGFGVGSTGGGGSGYVCDTCQGLVGFTLTTTTFNNIPPNHFLLTEIPGSAQNTTGFDGGNGFVKICYSTTPCNILQSLVTVQNCGPYVFGGTTYSSSGVYSDTLAASNGCDSIVTLALTINAEPSANINTQTSQCNSATGTATANVNGGTPGFTYLWTPGNATTQTISGLATGNYSVLITDSRGCTTTATGTVVEANAPAVAATSSASGCDNASGRAFATANAGTPPYSFVWFPSGGNSSTADSLPSGSYLITVTDANNCTAQANTVVNLAAGNQIDVNVLDVTLTSGDSVLLQATGASSYAWSPPEGLSCTNCANPIATPLVTTNYTVTGIDSLQCKSSALIKIQVEEPCGEVFFPTVFSPDNKGPDKNETLCAYGNCITELTYEIFNRWGQRVFRSNSVNECWDGKINGVPAEPGAFVYRATYTLRDKNSKEVYGTLILSK